MFDATRIRLYPTDGQVSALAIQFGCARWVWNNALTLSQKACRATGKGLDLCRAEFATSET
jgi:putative transposase